MGSERGIQAFCVPTLSMLPPEAAHEASEEEQITYAPHWNISPQKHGGGGGEGLLGFDDGPCRAVYDRAVEEKTLKKSKSQTANKGSLGFLNDCLIRWLVFLSRRSFDAHFNDGWAHTI